jgi:hypothetical protein
VSAVTQKWSAKIEAWEHSGLSLAAWCRENSESYQRALYWRRRFTQAEKPDSGMFIELSLPPAPISLECNGVLVHVARGFDPALLADVLSVLKEG